MWGAALGLVAPVAAMAQARTGTITGRVVEAGTGAPVPSAQIQVVGSNVGAITNEQGRFTIREVPARQVTVRVLRIGYAEQTGTVAVAAGGTATLDLTVSRTAVTLSTVVTTATGPTRNIEVGNAIPVVNVAKRVQDVPVRNIADALTAQAPGVQVQPNNFAGAGARIRIRGSSSLSLSNDPIYFIDGVRMTSNSGSSSIGVGGTLPSRVGDINPDEIETIEVVKGPSAASLYGTDAANGVIVITTKRGRSGRTQYNAYTEQGLVQDKNNYPDNYTLTGTGTGTTAITGQPATGANAVRQCTLAATAAGTCTAGTLFQYNPLRNSEASPLSNGNRQQYGLNVQGGTEAVRYFTSGEYETEIGPFTFPDFDRQRFAAQSVAIRGQSLRPSAYNRLSFRGNLNAAPSPKLDLVVSSNYINSNYRIPQTDNNITGIFFNAGRGTGIRDTLTNGYNSYLPGNVFQQTVNQQINRFVGSTNLNYRPTGFLSVRGDFGVDLTGRIDTDLCRRGECADFGTTRQGFATNNRANLRTITANLISTASFDPLAWLNTKSTIGAQYINYRIDGNSSSSQNLPPGTQTVTAGTTPFASEFTDLSKTLGLFVQQDFGIRDRLFLSGSLRTDQNSAFGTNFQSVVYPKGSISYVVSQESWFPKTAWLSNLRLLSAYGAAGRQPNPNDALRFFSATSTSISGTDQPAILFSALGNAALKPEYSYEYEGSVELGVFDNRVTSTFTYYSKNSRDALIARIIPPSAGSGNTTRFENLGRVKNAGLEALVNARLLQRDYLGWDVVLNGSRNSNRLVDLGGVPPQIGTTIRQIAGYPLNGYWGRRISNFADANNDGIIGANEITVDTANTFLGYSIPRTEISVTNGFDLFSRQVRLQGLVDYKGGFKLYNNTERFRCQSGNPNCRGINDRSAPLFEQARAVAATVDPSRTLAGYIEDGSFVRFRELTLTYTPAAGGAVARAIRNRRASVSFSARNLGLWTDYTGVDPETNSASNADIPQDFFTQSPQRYYTVRVNFGF
jgi:TonB-linked SusC/RagA family outer membrane protein